MGRVEWAGWIIMNSLSHTSVLEKLMNTQLSTATHTIYTLLKVWLQLLLSPASSRCETNLDHCMPCVVIFSKLTLSLRFFRWVLQVGPWYVDILGLPRLMEGTRQMLSYTFPDECKLGCLPSPNTNRVPTVDTFRGWTLRPTSMIRTSSCFLGTKDQTGERVCVLELSLPHAPREGILSRSKKKQTGLTLWEQDPGGWTSPELWILCPWSEDASKFPPCNIVVRIKWDTNIST